MGEDGGRSVFIKQFKRKHITNRKLISFKSGILKTFAFNGVHQIGHDDTTNMKI